MILYVVGLSSHLLAHMAQLEFPNVSIEIEGNRHRKLLNSNETTRNVCAHLWMTDIESARPIEINMIVARVLSFLSSYVVFIVSATKVNFLNSVLSKGADTMSCIFGSVFRERFMSSMDLSEWIWMNRSRCFSCWKGRVWWLYSACIVHIVYIYIVHIVHIVYIYITSINTVSKKIPSTHSWRHDPKCTRVDAIIYCSLSHACECIYVRMYTHTHTYTRTRFCKYYVKKSFYIYMYVCMCVYMCLKRVLDAAGRTR